MKTTSRLRICFLLGMTTVVPIILAMWAGIFLLIFHPGQPLLPDKANLTAGQYATHVLVVYALLIAVPGLVTLTLWGAYDYYRARRDPEIEADYQRRRAAANHQP
jgi:heme/copper-type cytochrome/quinol oxidase subunit 2